MPTYPVKCITMESNPDYEDCRGIETIGFPGQDTPTAERTPAQVYDMIEEEDVKVVVEHEGEETEVVQATYEGTKYVRTEPNDTPEDNLLKQPECS